MKPEIKIIFVLAGLLLLTMSLAAEQQPRAGYVRVLVSNETSYELTQLYYCRIGSETWSDDLLGNSTIDAYGSRKIDVPQGNLTLIAVYEANESEYQVTKDYRFRTGNSYSWDIDESREPIFEQIASESYGYYDDPYEYYDDPYGYYDPYGY
ncbi:MAG: hypothetical protein EHM28_00375 [Spirochaetaceae bacterium]|nr:MAG: hypothetical protein EHM28_00375 [Spirochaetaceae bacterium]